MADDITRGGKFKIFSATRSEATPTSLYQQKSNRKADISNMSASNDPKILASKSFKLSGDESVGVMIKYGIHNTFVNLVAQPQLSEQQSRRAVTNALEALLSIYPTATSTDGGSEEQASAMNIDSCSKGQVVCSFFSSVQDGLVEFSFNETTKEFKQELVEVEEPATETGQQLESELFEGEVMEVLDSFSANAPEKIVLWGVIKSLQDAVGEGCFKEVFAKTHALFGKLKTIYEKEDLTTLTAANGAYSAWFSVDLTLEKYAAEEVDQPMIDQAVVDEEQEREDESRMMMGEWKGRAGRASEAVWGVQ